MANKKRQTEDTFVFVGGPCDGQVKRMFRMISSELAVADGRVHNYRLRGTTADPVRSQDGFRILDHRGAVESKTKKFTE